jgi:uncharacterized coiled-coil protein SlyX
MRERESLIARVTQMRRRAPTAVDEPAEPRGSIADQDLIGALESRVAHLEHLLQGLQDSVHRESKRQSKRLMDLEARIEPAEISRALSKDARERGL